MGTHGPFLNTSLLSATALGAVAPKQLQRGNEHFYCFGQESSSMVSDHQCETSVKWAPSRTPLGLILCSLCKGNQTIVAEGVASFPCVCVCCKSGGICGKQTLLHPTRVLQRQGEPLGLQMSVGNCEFRDTSFSDGNLSCVETSTDISVVETSTVLSRKISYGEYFL